MSYMWREIGLTIFNLFITIIDVVVFCIASIKLNKAFSKSIKNNFVSRLLALAVADIISTAICIVFNESYNLLFYGSLYTPGLGIYLIPIVGRFYSLINIPGNLKTIVYFAKELFSDINSYYGYALIDSFLVYGRFIVEIIFNIIADIFIIVYMIVFLFKKKPATVEQQPVEVKVNNTVEDTQTVSTQTDNVQAVNTQNVNTQTVNRTVQTKKYPRINDEFVIEELKKYKQLLDANALTKEEFDAKKKQLLGL